MGELFSITSKLNPKITKFCELYVMGDDRVRGNATEAYIQAGYQVANRQSAGSRASALMAKPEVQRYIYQLQMQMTKEVLEKIKSWKELAVNAQEVIVMIMNGHYKNVFRDMAGRDHETIIPIRDHKTAAGATVCLSAAKEVLERAFPKKSSTPMEVEDQRTLEMVLGRKIPDSMQRVIHDGTHDASI